MNRKSSKVLGDKLLNIPPKPIPPQEHILSVYFNCVKFLFNYFWDKFLQLKQKTKLCLWK